MLETIDDVNELVHRRAFSVDYIKKRWGVDVQRENIAESRLPVYPRFSNLGYTNAGDIDYAYVYEYYKAPMQYTLKEDMLLCVTNRLYGIVFSHMLTQKITRELFRLIFLICNRYLIIYRGNCILSTDSYTRDLQCNQEQIP